MNKNSSLLMLVFLLIASVGLSQSRYMDRAGKASFFSEAPLENIEAHNDQVLSVLDTQKGEIAVSLLMKSFKFEKALMQEHFNEKYVESDKYPKATFKGTIANFPDLSKDGTYTVDVTGDLTIHGETNTITTKAKLVSKGGAISGSTAFPIKIADYKIQIPTIVVKNIAEVVEVKVSFDFKPSK